MTRFFHPLVLVTLCAATALAAEGREGSAPRKVEGTFSIDNPIYQDLATCRAKKGYGTLEVARCYEKAASLVPGNISIQSSLSLLYLKSDMIAAAKQGMNRTVNLWLDSVLHLIPEAERGNTSYVDVLRKAYDDAKNRNDTVARDLAVEMGMLIAKKFELDHKPSDSHSIYYGFLAQIGLGGDSLIDFHRRTGNIVALAHTGNVSHLSVAYRVAEAIPAIIDGLTAHVMSYGHISTPIRRMCGVEFTQSDEIVARHIIDHIEECVHKWGEYSNELAEADEERDKTLRAWSVLKNTAIHRLALLNAEDLLRMTLNHTSDTTIPADRFGRGLLHYAAAAGASKTIEYLVKTDSRTTPWEKEDKGRVQPAHLGCTSPLFRDEFEKVTRPGACDGLLRNRFEDENIDVTDDTGNDAGWNPQKKKKGENPHCDFDVRDASKMFQHDVNLAYIMANHPVLLRNVFFEEEEGPREEWRRRGFNKSFHDVLIRQEVTPMGERFGIGTAKVVTISEFLNTSKINDGTVGDVVVDNAEHRLEKVAGWVPTSLTRKKTPNEVTYFDTAVASPLLIVNKVGSKSHHYVRAFHTFHAVYYGQVEVHLLPPYLARSVRGQLPDNLAPLALRCNLQTGDVLVLPELWSMSWVSKANGISVERFFYRAPEQD